MTGLARALEAAEPLRVCTDPAESVEVKTRFERDDLAVSVPAPEAVDVTVAPVSDEPPAGVGPGRDPVWAGEDSVGTEVPATAVGVGWIAVD